MAKVLPRPKVSSRPGSLSTRRRARAKTVASDKRLLSRQALRARRKFLKMFPGGFRDEDYLDLERGYKWDAHQRWQEALGESIFEGLIKQQKFEEIAAIATRIESRTNLLFSFEKMALRDAVRSPAGAKAFSLALFDLLHGADSMEERFANWVEAVALLPRRKTRVLTWPLVTVFGFIAQPESHFFLNPRSRAKPRAATVWNCPTRRVRPGRCTGTCCHSSDRCGPISATCARAT
jgi:hypothetical protein